MSPLIHLGDPCGSLTFFTGPMASGKTLELVRNLQIFREQQIPMVCVRPSSDTRTQSVQSRGGLVCEEARVIHPNDTKGFLELISDKTVIGIDEAQLFPTEIVSLLKEELRRGKTILVSGLDTDFRGIPFPTSAALMALPETVIHRARAVCGVCRRYNATRTQRLRNGQPVPTDDPLMLIEGSDDNVTYEARCLLHHVI